MEGEESATGEGGGMGFAEQAESWRAKAHLTGVRLPVLVGVTALAAIVLIAAGGALVKAGTSDGFSLSRDNGRGAGRMRNGELPVPHAR